MAWTPKACTHRTRWIRCIGVGRETSRSKRFRVFMSFTSQESWRHSYFHFMGKQIVDRKRSCLTACVVLCYRCSREETGVLGKWRIYSDSQSLSYDKIPNTNLLAKVSGYSDLASYRPYWITMEAPDSMVSQVLACFDGELDQAKEVSETREIVLIDQR